MENDMKEILDFLGDLKRNNDREWFGANKDRYLNAKAKVELITANLIARIASFDPGASRLTPSECLYRIYRDTRFSANKTPYKTHFGVYINPPYGKKDLRCGYYLHIEPGNTLVAGGFWCPDAGMLKRVRQDIYDNVDEYLEIIENPGFKKLFPTVGDNLLKTAPKGFPKDWPHIELLKPRDFTAYSRLTDRQALSKGFPDLVIERMQALVPLNAFFNYTIESIKS